MLTADQIIARLDGSAAVARATGWPLTTIEGWREVNFVPQWRQATLVDLAAKLGKPIDPTEFPSVADRKSRARPAVEQAAA